MGGPSHERPMRADARRNYEHIVATARQVFTELGPEAPLDVIARRADVGNATLYRHFPTRDVLIEAVYRTDVADLAASALEFAEKYAPDEALRRWVCERFVPAQEQRGMAVVLKDALERAPEIFSQSKEQFTDAAETLVRAAQNSGDIRPDAVTRDILRMAHGIAVASHDAPEARERMLGIMFDGLHR